MGEAPAMMNRKKITVKEMYRRRADAWEYHYRRREIAKTFNPEDRAHILLIVTQRVPAPVMLADGSVMDGIETLKAQAFVVKYLSLTMDRSFMCPWYWSEENWMDFVRQYQALPDIYEPYYMAYNAEHDAMVFLLAEELPHRETQGKLKGNRREALAVSLRENQIE
jgi:hypothetical protein